MCLSEISTDDDDNDLPLFARTTQPLQNRDVRALLASRAPGATEDAAALIAAAPHPRLWRLLAEEALEREDWALAERGFVQCGDLSVRS